MQITLSNVKIMHSLSEETYCYTATVLVNGVRAFEASNHGHGGCDLYRPIAGYTGPSEADISAWLKENRDPHVSDGITLEYDLELTVGELLDAHAKAADRKRIEKSFERILGKEVAALRDGNRFVTFKKVPPTAANLAAIRAAKPELEIVNYAQGELRERALLAFCPDLAA